MEGVEQQMCEAAGLWVQVQYMMMSVDAGGGGDDRDGAGTLHMMYDMLT